MGQKKREAKRLHGDTIEEDKKLTFDLKSLWPTTKMLCTNGAFMGIAFAAASEALVIGGFSTFLPKFIETQYNMASGDAALYTGYILIPGVVGGIFAGAFLSKKYAW